MFASHTSTVVLGREVSSAIELGISNIRTATCASFFLEKLTVATLKNNLFNIKLQNNQGFNSVFTHKAELYP